MPFNLSEKTDTNHVRRNKKYLNHFLAKGY